MMAKKTGTLHVERFEAAAAGGDDEKAETLVGLLSPADIPVLRRMVESGDADLVWWGIRGLAQVGDEDVISLVVEGLQHVEPAIRAAAAMALGQIHSRCSQAVTFHLPHLALLLTDDNGLVRQSAADALARCGDDAVDVLVEALESEHGGVRVRAAAALHRIGSMKTALPLYHHLDDVNPLVRHYAYETLTALGLLETMIVTR